MPGMKIGFFAFIGFFMTIAGTLFADEAPKIRVVASFTVPADWVRQVAGSRAEVISLVPANADNHAYQPSPGDLKKIRNADFVFAISPKFETWLDAVSRNERTKNPEKFIFLGESLLGDNIACACGHHHHDHAHGEISDPHFWTDPRLVAEHCIPIIEKVLNADGKNFRQALAKFERDAHEALEKIPPERRKIVTYHNNMTHFAKRFGFEIAGTILTSSSTEAADPSAKTLARLSRKIREENIPIFTDNTVSSRLPATLAKSAGVAEPIVLRVDALDVPGMPADSYLGMLRENLRALLTACNGQNSDKSNR